MSVNSVTLTGLLGQDPEVKATTSGNTVMNFTIAVKERVKSRQTGEWEDETQWFRIVMFGNRAESLSRFISKGSKVTVHGRLRQRTWEDKEGRRRERVEVWADDLDFMSRQQRSEEPEYEEGPRYSAPSPTSGFYDEDCPFS